MKNSDFIFFDTVIVGSGAAGFNAAVRLIQNNISAAIITEGINNGTSRNTGSDKQTYYKLSLGGSTEDSVRKMAEDLFRGGCTDGDNALCEAALSVRCFSDLCSLGVPFPTNRYGEYIGYKTDHDPYMRATSAGPLTSRFMTEALEGQAKSLGVPIFDEMLAVEIAHLDNKVKGIICFNKSANEFTGIGCNNIILATGGPAGIYENTVYPTGHTGSTSLAIKAGAPLQNLTEWQYGLASISPKWNVSGTYMQVLPSFISVDENNNEHEFLKDCFSDIYEALSTVFLKGYQWPFDSKKAKDGSSKIDLAVYNECVIKGRRVFLDYRKNPFGIDEIDFTKLSEECFTYLKNADALSGTPIERLQKMNSPAIELYMNKGVDLTKERLEISLCAQHCNGGISVNSWWQTEIEGLFAAGECAGTHGVTRPGGSALNAGQTGSLRAAQYIASSQKDSDISDKSKELISQAIENNIAFLSELISDSSNVNELIREARMQFSFCAAAVRNIPEIKKLKLQLEDKIRNFRNDVKISHISQAELVFRYQDALLVQSAMLEAILDYYEKAKGPRGSALYLDDSDNISFSADNSLDGKIQMIFPRGNGFEALWRDVRPVPDNDDVFENVWKAYRINKNVY